MAKKIIICILIISGLGALLLGLYFLLSDKDYVAKIGNEKISTEEYYLYLYEQKEFFESVGGDDIWEIQFDDETSAESIAKANAIERVSLVKAALKEAEVMGISLTEEEKKQGEVYAEEIYNSLGEEVINDTGITMEITVETVEEVMIMNKVYDELTSNFVLSESDFNVYYQEFLAEHINEYREVMISYVYIKSPDAAGNDTLEQAEQAHAMVENGEDFNDVIAEYSDDYNSEAGTQVFNVNGGDFNQIVVDVANGMAVGEISEIITTDGGYYIIKVEDIIEPDMNAIEEEARAEYSEIKKQEIFAQEMSDWSEMTDIEINNEVMDNITLKI